MFHDGYSEGYPRRRYYQGNTIVDDVESLAIARAIGLFGFADVNVQPHSGSPANAAALAAMAQKGDTIMGLDILSGGHLTHGAPASETSRDYISRPYLVDRNTGIIDYDQLAQDAERYKPKVIIAGTTAYARVIDWERMAEIADANGAYLMADIAHVAGLVVAGAYPSPVPYAHVVTSTTHKSLRGPRAGLIGITEKGLAKNSDLAKKVNIEVFPRRQGGPHENAIAAMALAFKEAASPEFKTYVHRILLNARALGDRLALHNAKLITGGTDTHLLLLDATAWGIPGKTLAEGLEAAGIITNANSIPFDTRSPFNPSGLRVGTPAVTSRGMVEGDMEQIADWMKLVADSLSESRRALMVGDSEENSRNMRLSVVAASRSVTREIRKAVRELARSHPIPKSYINAA